MQWNREIGALIIHLILVTIIIQLFLKRNSLKPYLNYFFIAFGVTFIVDLVTSFIRKSPEISNQYNVYIYVYGMLFLFFFTVLLMYRSIIINSTLRKISTFIVIVFFINFTVNLFCIDLNKGFPNHILIANVFLLLVSITVFLLDAFKTDLVLEIKNYFPFWFSIGLIILYVGMVPLIMVSKISESVMSNGLWLFISFLINFIGYGTMLTGLLYSKKMIDEKPY